MKNCRIAGIEYHINSIHDFPFEVAEQIIQANFGKENILPDEKISVLKLTGNFET